MSKPLLQVEAVRVEFNTRDGVARVIDDLDIALNSGEILGIVGESGCGKSMTALSIMGLVPTPPGRITSGTIYLADENLLEASEQRMRQVRGNDISMIFQEPMTSLNPVFSIGDQIAETVMLHEKRRRQDAWDWAVEMLEAVGHAGIKAFFKKCNTLLKQDGLMVLQVITITDQRYEGYRRSFDFIRKYIFPGGLLPSVNIMSSAMTKFSSLHIEHLENIGVHYARTLYEWRKNFNANLDQVKTLGFDQNFIRMWNYYFSS